MTIMRALKDIGCHVTVLCGSKEVFAQFQILTKRLLIKDASGHMSTFRSAVACFNWQYDVILPVGELATNKITENEDEFRKYVTSLCTAFCVSKCIQ